MPVDLPGVGRIRISPPAHLLYYGAMAATAACSLIELPIALVLAASHALAEDHHSRIAQELGDALSESEA